MARHLHGHKDPALKAYRRNRTTYRTNYAPLGLRDPQQVQPERWCGLCGAEVYRPDTLLCRRCESRNG